MPACPLNVVVLGAWMRFPHGMAATNRVRLLARALQEAGADVRVLCLQAVDRPPHVENTAVLGTYERVRFEYAAGTTVRHRSFAMRRLIATWGWTHGAIRLVQLRRERRLDVVYLLRFWEPPPFVRTFLSFEGAYRKQLTPVGGVVEDIDRGSKAIIDIVAEGEAPSRSESKSIARGLSAATRKPGYGIYRMFDEWFGEDVFGE